MAITENSFYSANHLGGPSKISYDSSLKYKQLLGNFKTLFPKYILTNEQIQKNINKINEEEKMFSKINQ